MIQVTHHVITIINAGGAIIMSVIGSEPSDSERKILIQEFHRHVDQLLNQEDKDYLFYALKQYNTYRNVAKLVLALTSCLDSPEKLDLLPHIRNLIPIRDMKKYDSISPYDQMANPPGIAVRKRGGTVRNVRISRSNGGILGVNIRGGWEHNLGIFVSSVDAGSLAQQCGLAVGDQIISVNNISFEWITHVTAVKVLKSTDVLNITVTNVEKRPGQQLNKASYVWISTDGRTSADGGDSPIIERYKKVSVSVNWQKNGLGISLRGGQEYGIGLFISSVDNESRAAKCGLSVGDQIVEVNGHSFVNILHAEAVAILKSYQNLIITVKSIGKVPTVATSNEVKRSSSLHHSQTLPHVERFRTYSFHSSQSHKTASNKQQEKPVAQVKPKVVNQFPKQQTEKMSSNEWPAVTASTPSLQLTSSPKHQARRAESMKVRTLKSQSVTEVSQEKSVVEKSHGAKNSLPFKPSPLLLSSTSPTAKTTDKRFNFLDKEGFKFNSLPRGFKLQQSKAFIEGMGTQIMHASASHISAKSLLLEKAGKILKEAEYNELKKKVDQYENGMKIEQFVSYLLSILDTVEKLSLLTEVRSVLDPPDLATFDELVSPKEAEMLMEGQPHGSLLTAIKAHGGVKSLRKASTENLSKQEHELGPFGSAEALDVLNKATDHHQSKSARKTESFIAWEDDTAVAGQQRDLRKKYPTASEVVVIKLDKTCSTIGLSVDGGIDTSQKEIRVTAVKEGGSAHQHGFLKAGYEILEVDGEVVQGMKHRDACVAIHKAFKSARSKLEMVVVPTNVHNTP